MADLLGSSRISGECGLDLQEEVFSVAISVGHALDEFDAVVDTLQQTCVHGPAHTGEYAAPVLAELFGKLLQAGNATLLAVLMPLSPAAPELPRV